MHKVASGRLATDNMASSTAAHLLLLLLAAAFTVITPQEQACQLENASEDASGAKPHSCKLQLPSGASPDTSRLLNTASGDVYSSGNTHIGLGRKLRVYTSTQYTHGFALKYDLSFWINTSTASSMVHWLANEFAPAGDPEFEQLKLSFVEGIKDSLADKIIPPGMKTISIDISQLGVPLQASLVMYPNMDTVNSPQYASPADVMEQANSLLTAANPLLLLQPSFRDSYFLYSMTVAGNPSNTQSIVECEQYIDRHPGLVFFTGPGRIILSVVLPVVCLAFLAARLFQMYRKRKAAAAAAGGGAGGFNLPVTSVTDPTAAAAAAAVYPDSCGSAVGSVGLTVGPMSLGHNANPGTASISAYAYLSPYGYLADYAAAGVHAMHSASPAQQMHSQAAGAGAPGIMPGYPSVHSTAATSPFSAFAHTECGQGSQQQWPVDPRQNAAAYDDRAGR